MNESFAELLKECDFVPMSLNKKYNGVVVALTRNQVLIDSNLKSEVVIPIDEFSIFDKDLEKGQKFEYTIKDMDNGNGQIIGTRKNIIEDKKWDFFNDLKNNNKKVKGVVQKVINNGLVVSIKTFNCFVPKSLVDIKQLDNINKLVGQEIEVKVIKINKEKSNILVSRRAVIEEGLKHKV
jgi:small subunit ribosomal protein S1